MGCPGLVITQTGHLDLCESLLADHISHLTDFGVKFLVALIEDDELGLVAYEDIEDVAQASGIETIRFPIRDYGVPAEDRLDAWAAISDRLERVVSDGGVIALHCLAGDGRSGMMAADILKRLGVPGHDALAAVRSTRPGAVEPEIQRRFVVGNPA